MPTGHTGRDAWHAGAPEEPPSLERRIAVALETIAKHMAGIESAMDLATLGIFLILVSGFFK